MTCRSNRKWRRQFAHSKRQQRPPSVSIAADDGLQSLVGNDVEQLERRTGSPGFTVLLLAHGGGCGGQVMGEYRLAESQVLAQTAVRRRAQQREQYRKILLVLQANPRHLGVVGVPTPWIRSALKELPHLVLSPGALKSAQACRSGNVRLVWTRLAYSDRKGIRDYIARDPAAALAMDELFAQKADSLASFSDLGHPGRVTGTREMVAHKIYILAYDVAGDCVGVLRVLHAARQWPPVR